MILPIGVIDAADALVIEGERSVPIRNRILIGNARHFGREIRIVRQCRALVKLGWFTAVVGGAWFGQRHDLLQFELSSDFLFLTMSGLGLEITQLDLVARLGFQIFRRPLIERNGIPFQFRQRFAILIGNGSARKRINRRLT